MMKHSYLSIFGILLLLCLSVHTQWAQDAPDSTPTTASGPVPAAYPIDNLKHELVPLTAEEIGERAADWQSQVKEQATVVAEARIEGLTGDELDVLVRDQNALIERFQVILDAWEVKGGDPSAMRQYAKAVQAKKIEVSDPSSMARSVTRWMKAEDGAMSLVRKLIVLVLIIGIGYVLSSIISKLIEKAMGRTKINSQLLIRFVCVVVNRLFLAVAILVAFSTIGVNVGALVAVIGGGAFILGFALQDTLSNFANGVMLMIYRPFDVGDAVEVGGVSGSVDSVNLVNTTIRSWDNKIIIVPNKSVWGQTITNITGADQRRVDMVFGIGYGDDGGKAQSILEKILADHELVLKDPAPVVRLHELADSSVNFVCRPWAKTPDYWAVYWDVTKRVKEAFDAEGISIPFPQRDVHLHQAGS